MVAQDFDAELKHAQEQSGIEREYTLPGDKTIKIKEERIKCPDILFNPSQLGDINKNFEGIARQTHDSI